MRKWRHKTCFKAKTDWIHLVWRDNEVQTFLERTRDFKVGKAYEGFDWEGVNAKYEKIKKNLCQV